MNTIFLIFYIFLVFQRQIELFIAKRNEQLVRKEGAVEHDREGYKYIVLMHAGFFVSLLAEHFLLKTTFNSYSAVFFTIFIITQLLRYWAITSLGRYWNTRILVVPGLKLVTRGPYKYIRHPNYIAVISEIAVIPLIFSCYITAIVFSVLNFITLRRRIAIEEKALNIKS